MKKGKIIILNGVSSSGKTTLAKVIQDQSPIPLYKLDIDDFILIHRKSSTITSIMISPCNMLLLQSFSML